ncbi:hypothetical protein Tco_0551077 [Tanacetum coccineum]
MPSFKFYKRKFQDQDSQVMFSNLPHSHSLNCMDRETLERQVTLEEIKEAVWDCGSSKDSWPGWQGDPLSPFPFHLVMDGLMHGDIPFNYLGLLIGSNMKSIASWKTLVDRFHMRLSSWKANLPSIGGLLTLQVCAW